MFTFIICFYVSWDFPLRTLFRLAMSVWMFPAGLAPEIRDRKLSVNTNVTSAISALLILWSN